MTYDEYDPATVPQMRRLAKYPVRRIIIDLAVDADAMPYPTLGEAFVDPDGVLRVWALKMPDFRESVACALHEAVEFLLCLQHGVSYESICDFDVAWEKRRLAGEQMPTDEPGMDPAAPYSHQHRIADVVERTYAAASGLHWGIYDQDAEAAFDAAGWNSQNAIAGAEPPSE
jgi:hypothetical protein